MNEVNEPAGQFYIDELTNCCRNPNDEEEEQQQQEDMSLIFSNGCLHTRRCFSDMGSFCFSNIPFKRLQSFDDDDDDDDDESKKIREEYEIHRDQQEISISYAMKIHQSSAYLIP